MIYNNNIPNTTLRVALIGCGRIGSLHENDPFRENPCTHAGAIIAHPKLELISACDFNEERLDQFGKTWHVKSLYADFKEMLDREKPDIVSIAAWTKYHRDIVCYSAKAGVRGIYCEKPIAGNIKDTIEMVRFAKN